MVNFTVRLPRGPPEEGPWNEVVILNRHTLTEIRRAQNYGSFVVIYNLHMSRLRELFKTESRNLK